MQNFHYDQSESMDPSVAKTVASWLDASTPPNVPTFNPLGLSLTTSIGATIVGGLTGRSLWDWLYIETLAVNPDFRGLGIGRQLVQRAEKIAVQRDCVGLWVDTFTFQSPDFYERLGFTIFGQLDQHPGEASRLFMMKRVQ